MRKNSSRPHRSTLPDKQLSRPLDPSTDRPGLRYICVCLGLLLVPESINGDPGQRSMPP